MEFFLDPVKLKAYMQTNCEEQLEPYGYGQIEAAASYVRTNLTELDKDTMLKLCVDKAGTWDAHHLCASCCVLLALWLPELLAAVSPACIRTRSMQFCVAFRMQWIHFVLHWASLAACTPQLATAPYGHVLFSSFQSPAVVVAVVAIAAGHGSHQGESQADLDRKLLQGLRTHCQRVQACL